ncbi:MAG: sensor histidine kinase [Ignavibacteriaceae bacterium]|nr:sensor histidine kinase [Ignavibacteriaceae bacterium]
MGDTEFSLTFVDIIFSPVSYSVLLVTFIYATFYYTIKKGLIPLEQKHAEEKKRLEREKDELRSLFSDLDPNPVVQTDDQGYILLTNQRAQEVLRLPPEKGGLLFDLLPEIPRIDVGLYIRENRNESAELNIFGEHYLVYFRGLERLNLLQIYFNNIHELKTNELKVKELTEHMSFLQEHERERISRELHDGLSQSLTSAKMLAAKIFDIKDSPQLAPVCDELTKELDLTIVSLKDIALNLRPKMLNEFGLDATLRSLVKRISLASGKTGEYQSLGLEGRLDWKLESTLYRMTQELLNNIVKHSGAESFSVQVNREGSRVILLVSDSGRGFDFKQYQSSATLRGYGLFNLKEQVAFFNGRLEVISSPGQGTDVIIELLEQNK